MTTEVTSVSSVSGSDADATTTGSDYVSHTVLLTNSLQNNNNAVRCVLKVTVHDCASCNCSLLSLIHISEPRDS